MENYYYPYYYCYYYYYYYYYYWNYYCYYNSCYHHRTDTPHTPERNSNWLPCRQVLSAKALLFDSIAQQ